MPTRVRRTVLKDGTVISTVNLQSTAFGSDKYETCVFPPGDLSEVVARYPTKTSAVLGHDAAIAAWLLRKPPNSLV